MTRPAALAPLLLLLAGCGGGPEYASVSGVVTVDGKPYPNAVVTFQPIATEANKAPGRGSSAYTDENGRYELKGLDGEDGAVVGKHLVRIMTKGNDVVAMVDDGESSQDGAPKNRVIDPIPAEWNALSKKEFEVPPDGTDKADFAITSRKRR